MSNIAGKINFITFAFRFWNADVTELADVLDLGSSAARRGGSSPPFRTDNASLPRPDPGMKVKLQNNTKSITLGN